jgi:uncharacterized protein (DUF1778 family)
MNQMIREPFKTMRLDEDKAKDNSNVYTIRLNRDEESIITEAGQYFQQPKLSTLIKQLALLSARDVLQDKKVQEKLTVAINNVRRNMETVTYTEMPSDKQILGNVIQSDNSL